MFIISAILNSSTPEISNIIKARDAEKLLAIAKEQVSFGADAIDINCGTHFDSEVEDICWMVETLADEIKIPLCIDSPSAEAQAAALARVNHGRPIINSSSLEKARIEAIMPLVKQYNAQLILLLHDESGMPKDAQSRLNMMEKVDALVKEYEMDPNDIILDPLMYPLSTGDEQAVAYLETLKRIRSQYPQYQVSCGLDNISDGLPCRPLLNIAMVTMCAAFDQTTVLITLTPELVAFFSAIRALRGEDEFCMDYLDAYREGLLIYK